MLIRVCKSTPCCDLYIFIHETDMSQKYTHAYLWVMGYVLLSWLKHCLLSIMNSYDKVPKLFLKRLLAQGRRDSAVGEGTAHEAWWPVATELSSNMLPLLCLLTMSCKQLFWVTATGFPATKDCNLEVRTVTNPFLPSTFCQGIYCSTGKRLRQLYFQCVVCLRGEAEHRDILQHFWVYMDVLSGYEKEILAWGWSEDQFSFLVLCW